ncbi:MAG: gliding motility-associated C-terminal domain-containing protein [Flavobacteriales bacterium]|nr:gliding motility-associated C-terminal domain-containing protein [Flavobacteriales bacterium]
MIQKLVTIVCLYGTVVNSAFAQPGCPSIDVGPNLSVDCNVNCVDLHATILETGATTSYIVASTPFAPPAPFTGGTAQFINTDDIWGSVIALPFNFCFYGNQYSSLVIGANGLLSFDLSVANTGCTWSFSASIPSTALYMNSIMGAYHDIDPSQGGDISYFIQGTAPCRMFVVSFNNVPHFDCDCGFFSSCKKTTQQIVLYETTNVIEVYLQKKELCSSWNSGNAVVGIQNMTGTVGLTPPGRNTGSWTANNEAWRFTPNGTPNYVVNWYDQSNTQIGTGLTLNVCPSVTTTYTGEVIYTNCDGAVVTVTDQATVTQNSTVSVSVNPTTAGLCSGQSTSITASSPNSGISYTWSPSTGLSTTTGPTVVASPTVTTLYTVTANDGNCSASANANVIVGNLQLTSSSTDASCAGDDGTASVTASGGLTPYSYVWSTVPVQTTQTATGLSAGIYDVEVTDASGCPASISVTVGITLGSLSTPTVSATDAVCSGSNGTATATPIDGVSPFTYSWNTVPVQTTQTATGLAPGNYTATVTDNGGCSATASVTVGVGLGTLTATINGFSDASCNGSCDGIATATAQGGTAPFQFVWDNPTNQQTAQATGLCAGTYNVGIADANGCLATAQVIIGEPTAINALATMDQQSHCGNPDGAASVVANGGTVTNDYLYNWNSVPVQTTSTATGLLPATYTVSVTDDNGCSGSADIAVTTIPGFTASIAAYTDATCFQSCNGTATVAASANAIQPLTYSWNSVPVQNSATATNLCAGNYQVTVTDGVNCIATANVTISEPTKISAAATTSATPICIGESANLTAIVTGGTTPYTSYLWSSAPNDPTLVSSIQNPTVSPVFTTVYTLIAADVNGCITTPSTVQVVVNDPLSLTVTRPISSPDTGICPYDFAIVDLMATGGDGNYSYYLNPDLTTPLSLPMQVQPASTTTYNFTVYDGCTTPPAFASSTITVFILPTVDFVGDELNGCHIHTVEFTDNTNPSPTSWNWNFGDSNSGANTANMQNPIHEFSGAGLYTVSLHVQTADGCVNDTTKTDYIEVYPLPYANFSMNPEVTNVLNGTVEFTDLSSGDINEWDWSFGAGDESTNQNPFYIYTDTGTYVVWLHVTTIHGCEDETRKQVVVEPDFMFYVPNSFSPNNDGRNDYFRGYGEGVDWDSYEITIYNRWGEEIFFSADIEQPWLGDYEQMDVANEVYVWKILITDLNGEQHTYRGHVTVLR